MLIKSRRPRRNRYLQISIFIVIYSCYYAYSAAVIKDEATEEMPVEVTSMFTTIESTEVYERRLRGASDRLVIRFIVGSARDTNGRHASAPWIPNITTLAIQLLPACNRTISESTNEQEHTQSNGSFSYTE